MTEYDESWQDTMVLDGGWDPVDGPVGGAIAAGATGSRGNDTDTVV